ncbi:DUF2231 domain-containing protein [Actinokineospora iranica]|uniref:Predicted membrane protein n=1 Tax=Actinokineospora iranica TaxID=1271860 RepID=A0A1G6KMZ8_9PSEU|nr:DUF2231 domain-containing protein [Actinokineospora iranica]SDC31706.1 Predicted membrane protein [Actinokineospora iranica]
MITKRLLRAAESVSAVDGPVGKVAETVGKAVAGTAVDRVLRGSWLGHPVHPLLITAPIGAWTCAAAADFVFDDPVTARRLTGVGLAMVPAAVATGLVELSTLTETRSRRVGALHAATNAVSSVCFLASYAKRRRGAHSAGVAWSLLGLLAMSAAGALGGHLSYALGAGVGREVD